MVRSTGFSALVGLRVGTAAVAIVAGILACTDNTAPIARTGLDPSTIHVVNVPLSIKQAYYQSLQLTDSSNLMAGAFVTSSAIAPAPIHLSAVTAADQLALAYIKSKPDTVPQNDPSNLVPRLSDDGSVSDLPIGFDFTFYGKTYNKLNLYFNGFITFGTWLPGPSSNTGFWQGGGIPVTSDPNNMIALAWTDWDASRTGGSISYGLVGDAPHRQFVIQFKNVLEAGGNGKLTGQIVLAEGSNDITLFTTTMNITYSGHRVTQGIEDATGTLAQFDSALTPSGLVTPRVRGFFSLANDVVRFSPATVNQPPVVVPPANISVNTDPGVCTAAVSVGVATVNDDADGSTVAGVRSDAPLALDAAYPKGLTTITWTATDAGGLTASANQTVTVSDKQAPAVVAGANISTRTDRGASTATVVVTPATATDNCGDVTVTGARSDGVPLSAGYPVGVTTITWTSTDASGNSGSATQTVTVAGNLPPVISAPANISINTDLRECSAVTNPGTPVVTDDTDGFTVTGVRSDHVTDLNAAYTKGVTTIVWTAKDADGLTASASQTITVSDKEKPSIVAPASISTVNDPGLAYASVAPGSPSVSDNCAGVSYSAARSDGGAVSGLYPVGVTTVTWTATDASGNFASAVQSISVRDNESPVLTVPADFAVNATSPSGAVVYFAVSATDNVGVTSVSCSPASGDTFAVGSRSVTCTASDAAGNSSSKSFNVEVLGVAAQLRTLLQYVIDLNLASGSGNPLINQLRAVGDGSDLQGCTKMNDFLNLLAKKSADVTDTEYNYMISEATRIMTDMGCVVPTTLKPRALPRTNAKFQSTIISAARQ